MKSYKVSSYGQVDEVLVGVKTVGQGIILKYDSPSEQQEKEVHVRWDNEFRGYLVGDIKKVFSHKDKMVDGLKKHLSENGFKDSGSIDLGENTLDMGMDLSQEDEKQRIKGLMERVEAMDEELDTAPEGEISAAGTFSNQLVLVKKRALTGVVSAQATDEEFEKAVQIADKKKQHIYNKYAVLSLNPLVPIVDGEVEFKRADRFYTGLEEAFAEKGIPHQEYVAGRDQYPGV